MRERSESWNDSRKNHLQEIIKNLKLEKIKFMVPEPSQFGL